MRQQVINDGRSYERANLRNARVRRLTVWSLVALCGLCLASVWQDRALAPPLHDGMKGAVELAIGYVRDNEALKSAFSELKQEYAKLASDG